MSKWQITDDDRRICIPFLYSTVFILRFYLFFFHSYSLSPARVITFSSIPRIREFSRHTKRMYKLYFLKELNYLAFDLGFLFFNVEWWYLFVCLCSCTLCVTVANRSTVATKLKRWNFRIEVFTCSKCTANADEKYVYILCVECTANDEYSTRYSQHFGSDPNDNYEQFSIFNCDCCATPVRNILVHRHRHMSIRNDMNVERTALAVVQCSDVSPLDLRWLANNNGVSGFGGSGNDSNNNNKARETATLFFVSLFLLGVMKKWNGWLHSALMKRCSNEAIESNTLNWVWLKQSTTFWSIQYSYIVWGPIRKYRWQREWERQIKCAVRRDSKWHELEIQYLRTIGT